MENENVVRARLNDKMVIFKMLTALNESPHGVFVDRFSEVATRHAVQVQLVISTVIKICMK